MEVTTDAVNLGKAQMLITNESGDPIHIGEFGTDEDNWFTLEEGNAVSIKAFNNGIGVVSDGVSEVGVLYGGTGIFPPAVEIPEVDLSGYETISDHDSDLASLSASITSALAGKQPVDSDLTAIAALTTTSYGRAFLELANQAALIALLPSYQPLDSDLTSIAALSTTSYGRALLALADAASADWVTKALYDANTMLVAHTDNTPVAVTVSANQVVGRGNSGNIKGLTPAETAAIVGTEVFTQAQGINAQTGTTYTLVAGDAGKMVTLSNVSAITLTVPQDSDATIAVGTYVDLYQLGAGQVTVAAGSGATLRVSGLTAKSRAQYSRFAVQKVSANTWVVFGDLAAS